MLLRLQTDMHLKYTGK